MESSEPTHLNVSRLPGTKAIRWQTLAGLRAGKISGDRRE
jgi:hypothetical protein